MNTDFILYPHKSTYNWKEKYVKSLDYAQTKEKRIAHLVVSNK